MGLLSVPIAALATSVAAAGGVELTATAASLIGGIGAIGLATGLALIAGLLAQPPVPEPSDGQIETTQAIPSRKTLYGRREVSGALGMKKVENHGDAPNLLKIILIHDGELDAIETFWGDDHILHFDENGFVNNGPFHQAGADRLQMSFHDGNSEQPADDLLLFYFNTIWTADHRLRGIAYAVVNAKGVQSDNFMETYPHGEPSFKFTIRGRRLYDPRDPDSDPDIPSTWIWSDNAALAILDWLTFHPKGYLIPRDRLDMASFTAMASVCDEVVPLKDGGSELRYRVAYEVDLHTPKTDVLAKLRAACAATLYKTAGGKWAIRVGKWTAPTVTIDSARGHIIQSDITDGVGALKRYNVLEVRYLQPDNHYVENDADRWEDADDEDFIAGIERVQGVDFTQVPSHAQARRLAKILMAYDNPAWLAKMSLNYYGLNLVGEENLILHTAEPDEEGSDLDGNYWLDPGMLLLDNGAVVQVDVRSCDSTAFDWDAATEEGDPPPILPPAELDDKYEVGVPPDNPVDFAVDPGERSVLFSWTRVNAAANEDFYIARIWRGLTTSFADAVEISGPRYGNGRSTEAGDEVMTFLYPARGGIAYRYWLTVENPVGDRNTPVGPITATAVSSGESFVSDDFGSLLKEDASDSLTLAA